MRPVMVILPEVGSAVASRRYRAVVREPKCTNILHARNLMRLFASGRREGAGDDADNGAEASRIPARRPRKEATGRGFRVVPDGSGSSCTTAPEWT